MIGCGSCGHAPHKHLRTGLRLCTVTYVSGPPADNPHNRAYLHEGRDVHPCACPGLQEIVP